MKQEQIFVLYVLAFTLSSILPGIISQNLLLPQPGRPFPGRPLPGRPLPGRSSPGRAGPRMPPSYTPDDDDDSYEEYTVYDEPESGAQGGEYRSIGGMILGAISGHINDMYDIMDDMLQQ